MDIREIQPGVFYGEYEPGNSACYTAIAVRLHEKFYSRGALGSVNGGWLVVNGLNCQGYLFQAEGYLHPDYVGEKLKVNQIDRVFLTQLISSMIGR